MHHTMYKKPRYIPSTSQILDTFLNVSQNTFLAKKRLKKHTIIQQYIIQQNEKRLKKGYVDERVVVLLYGSRNVHDNPGNLPEF